MQIDDYISALPDSFSKSKESNNYKLLSLEQEAVEALRADARAIREILDIRKATGKTLDMLGAGYGQYRGSMTDEQYRIIILQKVARCFVGCDYDSLVTALATVFDAPIDSFVIKELEDANCAVEVASLPFAVLQNVGFSAQQAKDIIKAMLTVGVRLAPLSFEGTFEFAASADEYDTEAGFGDIDQITGGYFGYLEGNDVAVPV